MDGFYAPHVVAAASAVYMGWQAGQLPTSLGGSHVTSKQGFDRLTQLEFCRRNQKQLEETARVAKRYYQRERLLAESQLTALMLYFDDFAPEHAAAFFAEMFYESAEQPSQPVQAYRSALRRKKRRQDEWSSALKMIYAFKTFNAYMARRELKRFTLKPDEKVSINVPEGVN
jgi:hypothetical protein